MDTRKNPSTSPHGRRALIFAVAAVAALAIGATTVYGALGGGAPSTRADAPSIAVSPVSTFTPSPVPSEMPRSVRPQPSAEPAVDPDALADGVYPTYIRRVDVDGAMITVDVVQVFTDSQARQAAREDGTSWQDSRYLEIYLRNENDLLRTLPVADDVRIEFADGCVAQDRQGGLQQLREDTVPFTDVFYYDITVGNGTIVGVDQRYAIAGC
jgi:hypothetical protein